MRALTMADFARPLDDSTPAIVAIRGGMMFPRIIVQAEARRFLDEFGIAYTEYERGLYVTDSIESVCRIAASAIGVGAKVFYLMSVEDVMIREERRVLGLVVTDLGIKFEAWWLIDTSRRLNEV